MDIPQQDQKGLGSCLNRTHTPPWVKKGHRQKQMRYVGSTDLFERQGNRCVSFFFPACFLWVSESRYEPQRCYNFPQLDRRRNAKVDIYQHVGKPSLSSWEVGRQWNSDAEHHQANAYTHRHVHTHTNRYTHGRILQWNDGLMLPDKNQSSDNQWIALCSGWHVYGRSGSWYQGNTCVLDSSLQFRQKWQWRCCPQQQLPWTYKDFDRRKLHMSSFVSILLKSDPPLKWWKT